MQNDKLKKLKFLLKLESHRSDLARESKYDALRKTYSQRRSLQKNGNTGVFWDNLFNGKDNKSSNAVIPFRSGNATNDVEKDRDETAYTWLKEIFKPGMKVINVGCGNGQFESHFKSTDFKEVKYEGMDFAKKSIDLLKKLHPNFHFWTGDITKVKLKKYDIVCAFEILEHIDDYKVIPVLKKIYNSLNRGGFIMVAVPLNEPLLEMFPSNPNEHVRHYSHELICAELKISGFKVIKTEEFIAFPTNYFLKKFLAKTMLPGKWKPNDIVVLAQKK